MYVYRFDTNTYEDVADEALGRPVVIRGHFRPQCLAPMLTLREMERNAILDALERTRGVVKAAGQLLGLTARVTHYKIREHGLLKYTHIVTQRKTMQFARRQARWRKVG